MPATALQEESRAIVRRFFTELWSKGNLAVADDIVDIDAINDDPVGSGLGMGPEAIKRLVTMYRSAFPDLTLQTEQVIAEKEMVAIHWVSSGTHRADFLGAPPTGRRVQIDGISILQIERGKIAEVFTTWDTLNLIKQFREEEESE